jgi:photosystem II stability/assembly factor-like uncharacterized protein
MNNGLYKSLDHGVTWAKKSVGLPAPLSVFISPNDSSVLFALSEGNSASGSYVYRSANGGDTWDATNFPYTTEIIANPLSPSEYFGIAANNLYKSLNGGIDWNVISALPASGRIALHPTTGLMLLVTSSQQIYQSSNGGLVWNIQSTSGLPGGSSNGVLLADTNGFLLAVSSLGLYCSNNGAIWYAANQGIETKTISKMVAVPGYLYAITGEYVSNAYQGTLYRSTNAGQSWAKLSQLPWSSGSLTISVTNSQTLYLGSGSGYQISINGGVSWENMTANLYLPQQSSNSVLLSPSGTSVFSGNFRSDNTGETWANIKKQSNAAPVQVMNINQDYLHVYGVSKPDYESPNRSDGCLVRSKDHGVTWADISSMSCAYSGAGSSYSFIAGVFSSQSPETMYIVRVGGA